MSGLSHLERAVLVAMSEAAPDFAAVLRAQIDTASVLVRQNTGAGFYTTLTVAHPGRIEAQSPMGEIGAEIDGLQYGMGFLLWLEEGVAHTLEGYTYGDEMTDALNLVEVGFSALGPRRGDR